MNNDRSLPSSGGEALLNLAGLMATVGSQASGRGYQQSPNSRPLQPHGTQRLQSPTLAPPSVSASSSVTVSQPTIPIRFNQQNVSVSPVMNQGLIRPPNMLGQGENNLNWTNWDLQDSGLERGRSRNWTYEETLELITMYTSDEWQGKFSSEKKNHRAIWANLAQSLSRRKDVTGDEARQRLNNLKALYNRIKRQLLTGEISSPQWEYWDPLHSFLGRPQPMLPLSNNPQRSHFSPHGSPPNYRPPMPPQGFFNTLPFPTPRAPSYPDVPFQHPSVKVSWLNFLVNYF